MRPSAILFLLCLIATSWANEEPNLEDYQQYLKFFHKDRETRSDFSEIIFNENIAAIKSHNELFDLGKVPFSKGINQFTDMSETEVQEYVRGLPAINNATLSKWSTDHSFVQQLQSSAPSAPNYVNWVERGAVTSVKDQGECGSCAAFATTAALDSCFYQATGTLFDDISEQFLVDCAKGHTYSYYGAYGCNGAFPQAYFDYLETINSGRIPTEEAYRYTASDGQCQLSQSGWYAPAQMTSWKNVWNPDQELVKKWLSEIGPVTTTVHVGNEFANYRSGVLIARDCCNQKQDSHCSEQNNHAVTVVGYGHDDRTGLNYWLVKNSWGPHWGEKGFIRILRGYGHCGIFGMCATGPTKCAGYQTKQAMPRNRMADERPEQSNKSPRQDIEQKHVIVVRTGEICLSKKPVTQCQPRYQAEPGQTVNKSVAFTCLPVGRLADHYVEKAAAGQLLPELRNLDTTFENSVEQPKRCKKIPEPRGHRDHRWEKQCDAFIGGTDISTTEKVSKEDCFQSCEHSIECSHYTWRAESNGEEGTCVLKSGEAKPENVIRADSSTMVCGIVRLNSENPLSRGLIETESSGTSDTLKEIHELLEKLRDLKYWRQKYRLPKTVLLRLISKAQAEKREDEKNKRIAENESKVNVNHYTFAEYISKFALTVYDASKSNDKKKIANVMGLESPEDVLFAWFEKPGEVLFPDFVIVRDSKSKSIVLAIRGTNDLKDILIDLDGSETPFLDGQAHTGILTGAKEILKKSEPVLTAALKNNPTFRLIVTGHSLGAGTAVLAALDLLSRNSSFVEPSRILCIALAPPPVYRSNTPLPSDVIQRIEIYINNHDCVPSLSIAVIARLSATMKSVDDLELSPLEVADLLFHSSLFPENMDYLIAAIDGAEQEDFPYLQHPGTIFYMHSNEDQSNQVEITATKAFSKALKVQSGMLLDHRAKEYEKTFLKVEQDLKRRLF